MLPLVTLLNFVQLDKIYHIRGGAESPTLASNLGSHTVPNGSIKIHGLR
jgi:hypothetical protein